MNGRAPRNLVASVRDRLRTLARQQREDYNFTLMRYANERFLYRLGQSSHRGDFVLKGAMLLPLWGTEIYGDIYMVVRAAHVDVKLALV